MNFKKLTNKKIAILGLGIENYWLIKFLLSKKVDCSIIICDARNKKDLGDRYTELKKNKNIDWMLGKNYDKYLSDFNIVVRSPGYPLFEQSINKAKNSETLITSAMNLFFEYCPTKNIIGVTGTKGKGTISSLIYTILDTAKKKAWLGGNIGTAPFEFINKIKATDWVVLELSSFQLEDIKYSPKISVITNLFKEHLASADPNNPNYHKSIKEYWNAKLNIAKFQKENDKLVINKSLEKKISKIKLNSEVISFTKSELETSLVGEHNKENISAAVTVANLIKIKNADIKKAVKRFKGLKYRIEFIRELENVKYYNDSFATTPESSVIALKSFSNPVILLVGGVDKGSDFKVLAKEIKKRVKFVALLDGKATNKIKKELEKIKYPEKQMKVFKDINTAIKISNRQASDNDIVLLSPACASFGMFKNYKERGRLFEEGVKKLR